MKFAACLLCAVLLLPGCASEAEYVAEIDEWHAGRIDRLFELAARCQDRDPQSVTYCNFRWYRFNDKPIDRNAVQF